MRIVEMQWRELAAGEEAAGRMLLRGLLCLDAAQGGGSKGEVAAK